MQPERHNYRQQLVLRISHGTNGFTGRDWVTLIINVPGSCGDIYHPAYFHCLLQLTGTEKSLYLPREIPFVARLATFLGVTGKYKFQETTVSAEACSLSPSPEKNNAQTSNKQQNQKHTRHQRCACPRTLQDTGRIARSF